MRILHAVEFYDPSVGGAQEVVRQISRRLAARGHDVTVATTALPQRRQLMIDGVRIEPFAISGNTVRGMQGDVSAYQRFVTSGQWDVVMVYAAQQWTCDALIPSLPDLQAARVFAPCGFSGLAAPQYRTYFDMMPSVLRQYDQLIFHSGRYQDHAFACDRGFADRSVIVPNGCGADEFTTPAEHFRERYGIPTDKPMLLTVGTHTGVKGHAEAIHTLLERTVPSVSLVIVGNSMHRGGCRLRCSLAAAWATLVSVGRKNVYLVNPPRRDVVAAYHAADLFLFLSNVECSPLVLFEAAAAGTPFVTSDVGNAAEIAEWIGGGVVVPSRQLPSGLRHADPAIAASAVATLLADHESLREMGRLGRERWRARYTWEDIAITYERVYEEAVTRRRAVIAAVG